MSLKIKNLKKSFFQGESKIEILTGLNLELEQGEVVAILGESGSGKSTFLSLVSGLDRADSGSIQMDDVFFETLPESEITKFRAKNISIVFQQYHLMSHLTALENVLLPAEILNLKNANQRATQLLKEMGLTHRINHFPAQLSGGECQRVAIARALLVEPKLLLADEPSGNLDAKTGNSVLNLFFEMIEKNNVTTLFVTHSEALASRCHKVFRLENGNLNLQNENQKLNHTGKDL